MAQLLSAAWNMLPSWRSVPQDTSPEASKYAPSIVAGFSSYMIQMQEFGEADAKLAAQNTKVSYCFRISCGDIATSVNYANNATSQNYKMKMIGTLVPNLELPSLSEKAHKALLDYKNHYNNNSKTNNSTLSIVNVGNSGDLTKVDIIVKRTIPFSQNPTTIESELSDFREIMKKVKAQVNAVLKENEVPELYEAEGFVKVTDNPVNQGQKRRAQVTKVSSTPFPKIVMTTDLLNTRRSLFLGSIGFCPKSDFKTEYSFKIFEEGVVTAAFGTGMPNVYRLYRSMYLRLPSELEKKFYEGYRKYIKETAVHPEGSLMMKFQPVDFIKVAGVIHAPISVDPAKFDVVISTFWKYVTNISVSSKVVA